MRKVACGLCLALVSAAPVSSRTDCRDGSAGRNGLFHILWHDTGSACLTVGDAGTYRSRWSLGANGNMVAGRGWSKGDANRVVRYRADAFDPGANGYLSLYGWSLRPLVEYYIVDDYGPFIPPGRGAALLGTFSSDGGTYNIYRTQRVNAPSIAGVATFFQYWSVRTTPRPIGTNNTISFAHHVAAWRRAGLKLGSLQYQIVATEGFGSSGRSAVSVSLH